MSEQALSSSDDEDVILAIMSYAVTAYTKFAETVLRNLLQPRSRRRGGIRGRIGRMARSEHWWTVVVPRMEERRFKRFFRMPRTLFNALADEFAVALLDYASRFDRPTSKLSYTLPC